MCFVSFVAHVQRNINMSFFIRKGGGIKTNDGKNGKFVKRKEKRKKDASSGHKQKKKKLTENGDIKERSSSKHDEEIDSDIEDEFETTTVEKGLGFESDDDARETAQEKKVRLAKLYLEEIEKQERERAEAAEIDKELIAHRLREDYLEQAGKLRKTVAGSYIGFDSDGIQWLRCKEHKLAITCLVLSSDNKFLYSASKDCGIVKWSLSEKRKVGCILRKQKGSEDPGHTATVLSLAISSDNKFLASGDDNKLIHVWDPSTLNHVHLFKGHNGSVTGLAFRKGTHQLFSTSADKSVKIWSVDEKSYIETLFGHQTGVTSVDVLSRERAVTSGGRDHTVRIWKVVEESQLIYNGHHGSIDAVKLVNEEHFLSCGDDGQLCLWGTMKKKPLSTVTNAHGVDAENQQPNWISSIATLTNTDLVASGSRDGQVKLWKCESGFRSLTHILDIPVVGFVNVLEFTSDGGFLIVGVGQEHKLGRWWRMKEAKNGIFVIPLRRKVN